jgi:hypothetical protein
VRQDSRVFRVQVVRQARLVRMVIPALKVQLEAPVPQGYQERLDNPVKKVS